MNKETQLALIIYEFTKGFCARYLNGSSSKEKMILLAGDIKESASEASLRKLLQSYQKFAFVNDFEIWPAYSLKLRRVKGIFFRPYKSFEMYKPFLSSPEAAANAAICLINQIISQGEDELPRAKSTLNYGIIS